MGHKVLREYTLLVKAKKENLWKYITQLGMKNGWYAWGHFFKKRYTPVAVREKLIKGNELDFFTIESVDEGSRVALKAGDGGMDICFEISLADETGGAMMTFTTTVLIKNFAGSLYWLFVQAPDAVLQGMMMRNIKKYAEADGAGA